MKRLLLGLILVSLPFLAFYSAVACFYPNKMIKETKASQKDINEIYNKFANNNEEEDSSFTSLEKELLVVVDREHALASDYEPQDLVNLSEFGIRTRDSSMQLRRIVIADLEAMFAAAEKAGHTLMVFSAYRSYQVQEQVYEYWVNTLGKEEADRSSARPGHSEHQLGTTIDVTEQGMKGNVFNDFGNSEAGKWLAKNAHNFGFVMSYPPDSESITGYKHEPWHFRYVGKKVARIIYKQELIPVMYLLYLEAKNEK
jgi:D-alanyl-D-alanine carboxypeptidase